MTCGDLCSPLEEKAEFIVTSNAKMVIMILQYPLDTYIEKRFICWNAKAQSLFHADK